MFKKLIGSAVAYGAYKAYEKGSLKPVAKLGLRKKLEYFFDESEKFKEYLEKRKNKETHVKINPDLYNHSSSKGFLKSLDVFSLKTDINLNLSSESDFDLTLKVKVNSVDYKFKLKGKYEIKGSVIMFYPKDGDLGFLPEKYQNTEIPIQAVIRIDDDKDDEFGLVFNIEQRKDAIKFIEH